jgi:hypothetical protein
MSRLRILSALAAALIVGACSDTQSPTTPESEPAPSGSEEAIQNELRGEWGKASGAAALQQGVEPQHSPWLCNSGRTECMRVVHTGTLIHRVEHEAIARGNGCSRSIIKIAGVRRGRSGFVCHVRNDILFYTWFVNERWTFNTRIQVDFTGGGSSSPASFVWKTNW